MKIISGQTVLLTGASGGLGVYLAHALADLGMNTVLVAYPGVGLEDLKESIQKKGHRATAMAVDLRKPEGQRLVVEEARRQFGTIDLLVNNAGVEFTAAFHDLSQQNICDMIKINLEAPMMLTHLVLPEMLHRKHGHIVNMSSLAGKSGPAFQEGYAATKAALIAFTVSLRATYHGTGVGASVICPGFVEAGIYARLKSTTGCSAPALLGTSPPEKVAVALLRAIERDLPEVIVNPVPVRPLFAITALAPSLGEWLVRAIGAHKFFRDVRDARVRVKTPEPHAAESR